MEIANGRGIFTGLIICISEKLKNQLVAFALLISSLFFDLGKQNPYPVICSQHKRVRCPANLLNVAWLVKRAPHTAQLDRWSSEWMRRWRPNDPGELRARPQTGHI